MRRPTAPTATSFVHLPVASEMRAAGCFQRPLDLGAPPMASCSPRCGPAAPLRRTQRRRCNDVAERPSRDVRGRRCAAMAGDGDPTAGGDGGGRRALGAGTGPSAGAGAGAGARARAERAPAAAVTAGRGVAVSGHRRAPPPTHVAGGPLRDVVAAAPLGAPQRRGGAAARAARRHGRRAQVKRPLEAAGRSHLARHRQMDKRCCGRGCRAPHSRPACTLARATRFQSASTDD